MICVYMTTTDQQKKRFDGNKTNGLDFWLMIGTLNQQLNKHIPKYVKHTSKTKTRVIFMAHDVVYL